MKTPARAARSAISVAIGWISGFRPVGPVSDGSGWAILCRSIPRCLLTWVEWISAGVADFHVAALRVGGLRRPGLRNFRSFANLKFAGGFEVNSYFQALVLLTLINFLANSPLS